MSSQPAQGQVGEITGGVLKATKADLSGLRLPALSPELTDALNLAGNIGLAAGVTLGAGVSSAAVIAGAAAYKAYKTYRAEREKQARTRPWTMKSQAFSSVAKSLVTIHRVEQKTASGRKVHRLTLNDKSTGAPLLTVESEFNLTARSGLSLLHASLIDAAKQQGHKIPNDVLASAEADRKRIDREARIRQGETTLDAYATFGCFIATPEGQNAIAAIPRDQLRLHQTGASIALAAEIQNRSPAAARQIGQGLQAMRDANPAAPMHTNRGNDRDI